MASAARSPAQQSIHPMVAVRRALPEDHETVLNMRIALRREERPDRPPSDHELGEMTRRQLRGTLQAIFLAEAGGRAVGVLRCVVQAPVPSEPLTALLTTAWVEPAWRRRRIMTTLVAAAEAWSTARDVKELRLRNAHGNPAASATWEAMGFHVVQVVRQRAISR